MIPGDLQNRKTGEEFLCVPTRGAGLIDHGAVHRQPIREVPDRRRVTPHAEGALQADGRLTDAKTLIGLLRARDRLR